MTGTSGIGKSTNLDVVLCLQPQKIKHLLFRDGTPIEKIQVTWLKIDCPDKRSVDALPGVLSGGRQTPGNRLLPALGKERTRRESTMVLGMREVARRINLGLLIIDEIQFLVEARAGSPEEIINFLTSLVNQVKAGYVRRHIEGAAAAGFMPATARQATGFGDLEWYQISKGMDWDRLVEALWVYNYLRQPWPEKCPKRFSNALWEESQGITDFAIKLFLQTEILAIASGAETMSVSVLRSVAKNSLHAARPLLEGLKKGDLATLANIDGIDPWSNAMLEKVAIELSAKQQPSADIRAAQAEPHGISAGNNAVRRWNRPTRLVAPATQART